MSLVDIAKITEVVKTGAGYLYIYQTLQDYKNQNNVYPNAYVVNGVQIPYDELYTSTSQGTLRNLEKYAALFREAYDNGGKVTVRTTDWSGTWYESFKNENQVVSFPTLSFGQSPGFQTSPVAIADAPVTTSASKFIFTFQGVAGNATGSITYTVGASVSKEVTQGVSNSIEQSTQQTYSIGISTDKFGPVISANADFSKAWSQSQELDFERTDTVEKQSTVELTANVDFNGLPENPDGTFQLGTSKLIVGQKYVVQVKISHEIVTAYLEGYAPIVGPNIGWHNQWAPGSVTLEQAIDAAAKITGQDYTKGVPLEAKVVGRLSLSGEITPPTPSMLTSVSVSSSSLSSEGSSSTNPQMTLLAFVDENNLTANIEDDKIAKIDLATISQERGDNGIYLDLTKEDKFYGMAIQIVGNAQNNQVLLGDMDHTLMSFKNSIIESGSGYNTIIIKEDDIGNSYKLGGGGDTIHISGSNNVIDAGSGANSIIVRGAGTNTLISGHGADVIKLASKQAYLTVLDWELGSDKIVIGSDLVGENISMNYNFDAHVILVSTNDTVLAALYLEGSEKPKLDDNGIFQALKIKPIDLKSDKATFITELYTQALDRAPDRAAYDALSNSLDVNVSRLDLLKIVYSSDELMAKHASNLDFVTTLYIELLGRNPDEDGRNAWINGLEHGLSRGDVVTQIVGSAEFAQAA